MSKINVILLFSFSLLTTVMFQNCDGMNSIENVFNGKGTSTGNPSMSQTLHLSFAAWGDTATGATMVKKRNATIVTDGLQSVSVIMCINDVIFKLTENAPDDDADQSKLIPFDSREVALSPLGTDLDFITVPNSTYHQVQIDLNSMKCAMGYSMMVNNAYGSFKNDSPIMLKFNGSKNVDLSVQEISLQIQKIIEALATVQSDMEIKMKVEMVSGGLN